MRAQKASVFIEIAVEERLAFCYHGKNPSGPMRGRAFWERNIPERGELYRLACRHGGHGQHPDQQVRRGPARLRWIFMPRFLCVLHELLWAALCRTQ